MAIVTSTSAPCVLTTVTDVASEPVGGGQESLESGLRVRLAQVPEGGVAGSSGEGHQETQSDSSSGRESESRVPSSEVKNQPTTKTTKTVARPSFVAPKVWMVAFGVVLAICAGAVDTVTFRGLKTFTSHVTGTVAKVGMRLEGVTTGVNASWDVAHSFMLVGAFILGSFLCGLVIPKNQVHFGGKSFYGVALLGNCCLLIVAAFVAPANPVEEVNVTHADAIAAGCLAAMACGLQNAMCTMHFGAIVRTTHVTGTATDIGSTAGRAAMIILRRSCSRRKSPTEMERADLVDDANKLRVLMPIFLGFLIGTILGAFLHSAMGMHALLVPAMITGTTGFMYMFFRTQMKRQLKKLEERRLKEELCEMDAALHRAHSFLEQCSATDRQELGDLDDLLEHSLEVMHDVEATIADLYSEERPEYGLQRSQTL